MSELHAFRPVSTAFGKARKLLFEPFDLGLWVKLIIITFFVGTGTMSFNPGSNLQYSFDRGDLGYVPGPDFGYALSDTAILAIVLLIVAVAIVLGLVMSYLRGVFSFVLIDALTSGNVRVRQSFKENMGRGFKVFLFNILVAIVSIIVIGAIVVGMVLVILAVIGEGIIGSAGTWNGMSPAGLFLVIAALLVGLGAILLYSLIIGLFVGFFYDFGVPLMYFKNMGIRQSLGQVWSLVRKNPLEFLVYVIVRWALELVIAIVMGIVFLFVLAIFVAAGIIIVIAMLKAAETSLLLALPLALVLVVAILLLIMVSAVISMPIQVFLRYYSLDFLRSFDPSYVNYTGRFG